MVSIRNVGAASRVPFAWFTWQLRRHRAITRIAAAGLALSIAVAVSTSGAAQAGLASVQPPPVSILPQNVGIGVLSAAPVTVDFGSPMDRSSVEKALSLRPAQPVVLTWSADSRTLRIAPGHLWRTDQRYLVLVGAGTRRADGWTLDWPAQFSFTTQTAPRITDFRLRLAGADTIPAMAERIDPTAGETMPLADVAGDISSSTAVRISFGAAMNHADVERAFTLTPAVSGRFSWDGLTFTFRPSVRLAPNARYAVSLAGAHDAVGNPLGGDTSFSFTTRPGAQLVKVTPSKGATGVTDGSVVIWFSEPMDGGAVAAAMHVTDQGTGAAVAGTTAWNESYTQLRFTPTRAFAAGHKFEVSLASGSIDADGNPLTSSWVFTTRAAVVYTPQPAGPRPAPSSDAITYALNQINAARAAHGLAPLALSSAISSVAAAHAWDQLENGYFSHTGLDGSSHEDRLRRAGISFGWSGENECTYTGYTNPITVLDKCHAYFMSEPYPGVANHIGNILSTHFRKVGIGIAQSGSHIIIVWDFTD